MLAIAAAAFDEPSQTFVRDHVAHLAPGETILISQAEGGIAACGVPSLTRIDPHPPFDPETATIRQRVANSLRARWKGYLAPGLRGAARRRVADFLREHRPAAVMAEFGNIAVMLMGACKDADVPLYAHFHGVDVAPRLRYRHVRAEYRALFDMAAGVIGPSAFITGLLRDAGCPADKLHVSACGVDPNRFSPTTAEPLRALSIGRFVEKKAPHRTVEAFAEAARRFPDARLDMVGDGPLLEPTRALVARLGMEERITLHGLQPPERVAAMMGRAAVFLQHSVTSASGDTEGLPVVILEAMSAEAPVVSTRHSGIAEAVVEGRTGLLVDEHDVTGMARAIEAIFDDPVAAAAMGRAGRARVLEQYTHQATRDRLRAIMKLPPAT